MSATEAKDEAHIWEARRSGTMLRRAQSEYRESYVRDRARVIHSAGFRRLQAKTQVLGIGEGDFHRTRLTHSMEVAQIARGITRHLQSLSNRTLDWSSWLPSPNLIEAVALCHDLGHPPFGHGGEVALNFATRDAGGFEGNGQTLRLLSRLEAHTDGFGLDLTRRSMLGVLKYPVSYERVIRRKLSAVPVKTSQLNRDAWKPPKCFLATESDVVQWLFEAFSVPDREAFVQLKSDASDEKHGKSAHHSFDTSIMELADDIAYGVHDFEDAISLKLVSRDDWEQVAKVIDVEWGSRVDLDDPAALTRALFDGTGSERKRAIGCLVNAFVVSIRVEIDSTFEHPLLKFQARLDTRASVFLERLKDVIVRKVIKTAQVQTLEYRGQQLIVELFEALQSDPMRLMKDSFRDLYDAAGAEPQRVRVICDYIAGMTDEYATRMFERLFVPRHGQFSDRF